MYELSGSRRWRFSSVAILVVLVLQGGIGDSVTAATWQRVASGGFGDPANREVGSLGVFNNTLYAGTANLDDQMVSLGAAVWQSTDGVNWRPTFQGGYDNIRNHSASNMAAFKGFFFVTLANPIQGVTLLRTLDGITWEPGAASGFGNRNNIDVGILTEFDGWLYATTTNAVQGAQIWRTRDGYNWAQVGSNGFGSTTNMAILALQGFKGELYAGTTNIAHGVELWRSDDGSDWEVITRDGFSDSARISITAMHAEPNLLIVHLVRSAGGSEIITSGDGVNYVPLAERGFWNPRNQGVLTAAEYSNAQFAVTLNPEQGLEVWRYLPSFFQWFPVARDGISSPDNAAGRSTCVFNGSLYLGTANTVGGGEVFRMTGADNLFVSIRANDYRFQTGQRFLVEAEYANLSIPITAPLCLVLDLGPAYSPQYFFAPSWSSEFSSIPMNVPAGSIGTQPVFDITLPRVPALGPIRLYGAFLDKSLSTLISPLDSFCFYFEP